MKYLITMSYFTLNKVPNTNTSTDKCKLWIYQGVQMSLQNGFWPQNFAEHHKWSHNILAEGDLYLSKANKRKKQEETKTQSNENVFWDSKAYGIPDTSVMSGFYHLLFK